LEVRLAVTGSLEEPGETPPSSPGRGSERSTGKPVATAQKRHGPPWM